MGEGSETAPAIGDTETTASRAEAEYRIESLAIISGVSPPMLRHWLSRTVGLYVLMAVRSVFPPYSLLPASPIVASTSHRRSRPLSNLGHVSDIIQPALDVRIG